MWCEGKMVYSLTAFAWLPRPWRFFVIFFAVAILLVVFYMFRLCPDFCSVCAKLQLMERLNLIYDLHDSCVRGSLPRLFLLESEEEIVKSIQKIDYTRPREFFCVSTWSITRVANIKASAAAKKIPRPLMLCPVRASSKRKYFAF